VGDKVLPRASQTQGIKRGMLHLAKLNPRHIGLLHFVPQVEKYLKDLEHKVDLGHDGVE
jgi:hypothetical protein